MAGTFTKHDADRQQGVTWWWGGGGVLAQSRTWLSPVGYGEGVLLGAGVV